MTAVQRFEDVEAWKKGRELAVSIYRLTGTGDIAKDFALRDQLRRASLSVISNIAEGFERGGDRELRRFLAMAKGSAGEVRAQLHVAHDIGLIDRSDFDRVVAIAMDTSRLIAGFVKYLDECLANPRS